MKIYYKAKTTFICTVLALGMLSASYWQYLRYEYKSQLKEQIISKVSKPPIPIETLEFNSNDLNFEFQRILANGKWDFEHEFVLRNRGHEGQPGVNVITPLLISDHKSALLVNRGFIPITVASKEKRKDFQKIKDESFLGLLRRSTEKKALAPQDPKTHPGSWIDEFLRIDINWIAPQMPYPLLPYFLEKVPDTDNSNIPRLIMPVESSRDEMMFLPNKGMLVAGELDPNVEYPVPVLGTIAPPELHFGYILEWVFMAILTLFIGVVLQLKPYKPNSQH